MTSLHTNTTTSVDAGAFLLSFPSIILVCTTAMTEEEQQKTLQHSPTGGPAVRVPTQVRDADLMLPPSFPHTKEPPAASWRKSSCCLPAAYKRGDTEYAAGCGRNSYYKDFGAQEISTKGGLRSLNCNLNFYST